MNVLILDGTLDGDVRLCRACDTAEARLLAAGAQVERLRLRDMKIRSCCARFNCWLVTPGTCTTRDDGARVGQAMLNADALILVTPVSFGAYGSLLKSAMDRCLPILLPFFGYFKGEIHHTLRGGSAGRRLCVLGGLPAADAETEAVLTQVVDRNALNMRSAAHGLAFVLECEDNAAADDAAMRVLDAAGIGRPEVVS